MTNLTFYCQLYMKLIVLFFRLFFFFFSLAHYKKHHVRKLQNLQVCVWHLLRPVLKASHPLAEENKTNLFSTTCINVTSLFSVFALMSISCWFSGNSSSVHWSLIPWVLVLHLFKDYHCSLTFLFSFSFPQIFLNNKFLKLL